MATVIGFAPAPTAPAVNERLLFAFQVLIGYTVEVQVSSGCHAAQQLRVTDSAVSVIVRTERALSNRRSKLVVCIKAFFAQLTLKIQSFTWSSKWPN